LAETRQSGTHDRRCSDPLTSKADESRGTMRFIQTRLGRVAVGIVVPLAVVAGLVSAPASQAVSTSPTAAQSAASMRTLSALAQSLMAPAAASAVVAAAGTYTLAQVAQHSTQSDCWTVINGGVYNLNQSSFITNHEGGTKALLPLCGIDGSGMFNTKHGRSGDAAGTLSGLRIGAFDPTPPPVPAKTFTFAEVQAHATASNCYSAINGIVYNLTAFVSRHAGGTAPITGLCGFDGSGSFNGKHSASSSAKSTLALYSIGTLTGPTTTPTPATVIDVVTLKKHALQSDCWSAINGTVYNLTTFIGQHAGPAAAIIALCGIDGSASFNGKHGAAVNPNSGGPSLLAQQPKMGTFAGGTTTGTTAASYTMADVALHNKPASDCWVAIVGGVYDLTTWKGGHSGTAAVIDPLCGTDGTATFQGRHGAGTAQFAVLAAYKKGTIAGYVAGAVPAPATVAALNVTSADYTMADIALHGTASDCWSAINGGAYNLTSWVSVHPGGSGVIKAMCGSDGSGAYTGKHGGSGSAGAILAKLRIGNIVGVKTPVAAATVAPAAVAAATSAPMVKRFTFRQIQRHQYASNCWTAVNGNVYNLTAWTKKHANRKAFVKVMCGRNGTRSYNKASGGAAKSARNLKRYKIGVVATKATAAAPVQAPAPSAAPAASGLYAAAQVATHASATDCWSIVSGGVYNLTTWIGQHPGGPGVIKAMCGTDGTASFNGMHSSSATAKAALDKFKIGIVG
jgi:cytochrome b involved in lipid metabolism